MTREGSMAIQERIPAHNLEAEEGVLGCLLLDWMQAEPQKVARVMASLKRSHFYREKNSWVYAACQSLYKKGWPIDELTVSNELAEQGKLEAIGGAAYVVHLVAQTAIPLHLEYYARIVIDAYGKRI